MAYRPVRKKHSRIWGFQLKLILPMKLRLSGHFYINCNAKRGYLTMVVPPKGPTPAKHCGIRGQCGSRRVLRAPARKHFFYRDACARVAQLAQLAQAHRMNYSVTQVGVSTLWRAKCRFTNYSGAARL
jgi:hypothetical protein